MKLTLLVKLEPDEGQAQKLLATLESFNDACNYLAGIAFELKSANKYKLQNAAYHDVRDRFKLSAQMAIRAIAKVSEAYKRDRSTRPVFGRHGAMVYDERIMAWKSADRVSLLTLDGRVIIPVRFGPYQAARMERRRGQADLIYRDKKWFLAVTVDAPEADPIEVTDTIGVDLGIVNIASDSDGKSYSGEKVNNLRSRHRNLRSRLQRKGTKSARRLANKRKRKESRFARDVNHRISKEIVAKARDTKRAIALEELTHIRERTTVRRLQRATHSSWSFHQLRFFIEYKARQAGVSVVLVNPRNTSRTCPACGCIDKRNRPSQRVFSCVSCGCSGNADSFAALNIRERGRVVVNLPNAA